MKLEVIPVTRRQLLLERFRAELKFLDSGGYRRSTRSPWRSAYLFEESPSCPNYSDASRPHRCSDCWLLDYVSPDSKDEQIPCRFVQLNQEGVTVDSLYRYGTSAETEIILRKWLLERIHELEAELAEAASFPFAANY
jgi:hypothetical protein